MAFTDRLHNRGSISTGYDIDNSLKLESDNSEYIDNRHNSAGNQKTWTLSFWIKRTELGTTQKPYDAGNVASIGFLSSDKIQIENTSLYLATDRVFRDTSAWYHIVLLNDSTQSTASNRAKLWINGVQETSFSSETYMPQNQDGNINSATSVSIGGGGGAHVNGYMAELFFVDGQALAPTDFGEFDSDSGIWIPKEYDGTLSGTSIKLDFSNSSALWEDSSGLSGNGTVMSGVNITSADQATDTPTNNFCTLNILNALSNGGGNNEYTEGATKGKALQVSEMASGTMAVTQGKWYYECKAVLNSEIMAGWGVPNKWGDHSSNPGYDDYSFAVHNIGRVYYSGNSFIDLSPSVSFDTTDIVSCAIDIDNGFCYWAKNGTWMNGGNPTSGATGTGGFDFQSASAPGNLAIEDGDFLIPAFRTNYYTNSAILVNFGGYTTISISSAASDADGYGTFEYAPPSGYYALCTKNLAEYG